MTRVCRTDFLLRSGRRVRRVLTTCDISGWKLVNHTTLTPTSPFDPRDHLCLLPGHFHHLSHSTSPSNTIPFPLPFPHSYPIHLDDDAWLSLLVSIVTVIDAGALFQQGAVELTGALWVVLHVTAVLLQEVLIRGALIVLLDLCGVVVG